jgi:hypothetical protein
MIYSWVQGDNFAGIAQVVMPQRVGKAFVLHCSNLMISH